mmetsp:Transcript_112352/g.239931  ORF Transcript_112352/g.239931 Transcript_112352/m.239931 type:complete len:215 (+) Transcript_112352:174-818(+)
MSFRSLDLLGDKGEGAAAGNRATHGGACPGLHNRCLCAGLGDEACTAVALHPLPDGLWHLAAVPLEPSDQVLRGDALDAPYHVDDESSDDLCELEVPDILEHGEVPLPTELLAVLKHLPHKVQDEIDYWRQHVLVQVRGSLRRDSLLSPDEEFVVPTELPLQAPLGLQLHRSGADDFCGSAALQGARAVRIHGVKGLLQIVPLRIARGLVHEQS